MKIGILNRCPDLAPPARGSSGASGFDLRAAVDEPFRIESGHRMAVPTGITIAIPPGWEGQVRPRSGLALKNGVTVLNAPGTIDSDYRGEIQVILVNLGESDFMIRRGDRIAQLVIAPISATATLETMDTLDTTERGDGGFGSTG